MKNDTANTFPRFRPSRTIRHSVVGLIDCYNFSKLPRDNDAGAQTRFYMNNATPNNARHYGIKLFNTIVEAFAAYQRQKIAAKAHLAPPVRRMVCFRVGNRNYWGYQTCIALVGAKVWSFCVVRGFVAAQRSYSDWSKRVNGRVLKVTPELAIRWSNSDEGRGYYQDLKVFGECWDYFEKSTIGGALSDLSDKIVGTQFDNLNDFGFNNSRRGCKGSARLMLGSKWCKKDRPHFGADLHRNNVGVWKGNPVVIDFGYHIVEQRANFAHPAQNRI